MKPISKFYQPLKTEELQTTKKMQISILYCIVPIYIWFPKWAKHFHSELKVGSYDNLSPCRVTLGLKIYQAVLEIAFYPLQSPTMLKIPSRAQPIKGFIYTIKGSNVYMNMTKQTYDFVYALTLLKVDSCPASSI